MNIWVRNLRTLRENMIELPQAITDSFVEEVRERLGSDEYIIIEHSLPFHISEFTHVICLLELLQKLNDEMPFGVESAEFAALCEAADNAEEVLSCVREEKYVLVSENEIGWTDNPDETDFALCIVESGLYHLPFEYRKEMESFIDWSRLWSEMESSGWMLTRNAQGHERFAVCISR